MTAHPDSYEQLATLFALGREVASVLDLDELLQKIPQLIARLTTFRRSPSTCSIPRAKNW